MVMVISKETGIWDRFSMFPENHCNTLKPTSDDYPDVDTYRTMEFYLELAEIFTIHSVEE